MNVINMSASAFYFCVSNFSMSVMILLLLASLVVAIVFLVAFIWSVKNGQYDDDVSPAHKILFEDLANQKSK